MSKAQTVTGRVVRVQRHGHTVYGNPIMSVVLELPEGANPGISGHLTYRIRDNASLVYGIDNAEYRDEPHVFELTRAGRISGRVWTVSAYLATQDGRDAGARRIHNARINA